MIKIKFHLQRGKNYQQFQIRENQSVKYVVPESHSIVMQNCYLKNLANQATKIYQGANRQPCGWVYCQSYHIVSYNFTDWDTDNPIFYNPKVAPYWRDKNGSNIDDFRYPKLITLGRQVYII